MTAPTQHDSTITDDSMLATQPLTLPMRDEFGAYFTNWNNSRTGDA